MQCTKLRACVSSSREMWSFKSVDVVVAAVDAFSLCCCSFFSCYHSSFFLRSTFSLLLFLIYWDIEFLCSPNVIPCANRTTPIGFGIMWCCCCCFCCRFFSGSTINGRWKASEEKFSPMEPNHWLGSDFLDAFLLWFFILFWRISSVKRMKNKPKPKPKTNFPLWSSMCVISTT